MPTARARHRRQLLLLLRHRPPDHRAATRTRRPARRASAGLDALPRLATSPPTAMPRGSQIAASIKSRDAQDPAPILVTGPVLTGPLLPAPHPVQVSPGVDQLFRPTLWLVVASGVRGPVTRCRRKMQ